MKQLSAPFLLVLLTSSLYVPQTRANSLLDFLKTPAGIALEGITASTIIAVAWLATKKENIEVARERAALKEKEAATQKDLNQSEVRKQEALNQANLKQEQEVLKLHAQAKQKDIEQQNAQKTFQAQQFVKRIQTQYDCGNSESELDAYTKKHYSAVNSKTPHLLFFTQVKNDLDILIQQQAFLNQNDFEKAYSFLNGIYQNLNYHYGETIQNHQRNVELDYQEKLAQVKKAKVECDTHLELNQLVKEQHQFMNVLNNSVVQNKQITKSLTTANNNINTLYDGIVKIHNAVNAAENKQQDFRKNVTEQFEKQREFRAEQREFNSANKKETEKYRVSLDERMAKITNLANLALQNIQKANSSAREESTQPNVGSSAGNHGSSAYPHKL